MRKILFSAVIIGFLVSACGVAASEPGMGFEMGQGGGMSMRHHATVPDEYASFKSPSITQMDIDSGSALYASMCASCHGDGGMGDGPAASALDPAPAPIAHTSTMLGDGYLYWRIAEGGSSEFGTTMPSWKGSLSEEDIWAVIAYIRALGSGGVDPSSSVGGDTLNPEYEAVFHEEMLAQAVDLGLISEDESTTFSFVHDAMDEYRTGHADGIPQGSVDENQDFLLSELIGAGEISQSQADDFVRIHQLLLGAGLME